MQGNRGTWIGRALQHGSLAIDRFIIVGNSYFRCHTPLFNRKENLSIESLEFFSDSCFRPVDFSVVSGYLHFKVFLSSWAGLGAHPKSNFSTVYRGTDANNAQAYNCRTFF